MPYSPPPRTNVPFNFDSPGTYFPPPRTNVPFNFTESESTEIYNAFGIGIIRVSGTSNVAVELITVSPYHVSTHFTCTIDDIIIPVSSIEYRINQVWQAMAITVPDAEQYDLVSKIGHNLLAFKHYVYSDGSIDTFQMFQVPIVNIKLDKSPYSKLTAVISGNSNIVLGNTHDVSLNAISYHTVDVNGKHTYRCELDPRIRPGNNMITNDGTFEIGEIVWYIEPFRLMSEIREF